MPPANALTKSLKGLRHCPSPLHPKKSNSLESEVLLQEMLCRSGVLRSSDALDKGTPEGTKPCARRLACHWALVQHLLATEAFGPLQRVMQAIVAELELCLYSDQARTPCHAAGGG